jgi:hypothetical protein
MQGQGLSSERGQRAGGCRHAQHVREARQLSCTLPLRPLTHLACRGLPDKSLRHSPCLQGVIKPQTADVRVGTDPFNSGEVGDRGVNPHVRHAAANRRECTPTFGCASNTRLLPPQLLNGNEPP